MVDILATFDQRANELLRKYGLSRGGEGGFGGGLPGAEVQPDGTQRGGGPRQMKAKTPSRPFSLEGILGAIGDAAGVIGLGFSGGGPMGPFNIVQGAIDRPGNFSQPGAITPLGQMLEGWGAWGDRQVGIKSDAATNRARQGIARAASRGFGSFGDVGAGRRGLGGNSSGGRSADPSNRGANSRGASGVGSGR